ncbi:MAG: nucleoside 2-deoxyribosyltransferase [Methanotrichaceae archaeon]|nr:nucleoside 2-deoxyribosyltransferase [Methanotrichaceae archaeon]
MKFKIYLSGPLFSQAEVQWANKLKVTIEEMLEEKIEVLWPHEMSLGSTQKIFGKNIEFLTACDLMVAILDGPQVDDGTAWEIGYFFARGGNILGIRTDFRKAGEDRESNVNLMIEHSCLSISRTFEQLLAELMRILV